MRQRVFPLFCLYGKKRSCRGFSTGKNIVPTVPQRCYDSIDFLLSHGHISCRRYATNIYDMQALDFHVEKCVAALTLCATLVRREKAASILIERNGDLSITSRGRRIHGHSDAIKV